MGSVSRGYREGNFEDVVEVLEVRRVGVREVGGVDVRRGKV